MEENGEWSKNLSEGLSRVFNIRNDVASTDENRKVTLEVQYWRSNEGLGVRITPEAGLEHQSIVPSRKGCVKDPYPAYTCKHFTYALSQSHF